MTLPSVVALADAVLKLQIQVKEFEKKLKEPPRTLYVGGGGVGLTSAVTSLSKSGSAKLINDVTVSEGSNVTLTQAGQNIEIAASGGGGVDHNILSATHLDSLAGTVVRGDVIVANSTPKWARLPIGLINYLLKSDGTDVLWGLIVNANVDATAAIVESKLALNYPTHAEAHTLASHSTKAHTELTDVTADQHHAEAHTLASHSTKAHSELTGVTSDQHHAQLHKDDHVSTGGDAFANTDLLEAVVKRLQESSGPTNLTLGNVADGQYLKRSGTTIVGDTPAGNGGAVYAASIWCLLVRA